LEKGGYGLSLTEDASEYLEAEGFRVDIGGEGLLVGDRPAVGGERERIYVWAIEPEDPSHLRQRERSLVRSFGEVNEADPGSDKFLLLSSQEGLSADLRRNARPLFGVRLAQPTTFFDTAFGWESARGTATATSQLSERGRSARSHLVPQPFADSSGAKAGDDLLFTLTNVLLEPAPGPRIHIVAGPAGIGKSAVFESLFATLFEEFQTKKRSRVKAARPLPLLPEYLERADARTIRSLLASFLSSDFVRPLNFDVFRWMLTHRYALWMLDGLDEIIAIDPGFFDTVLDFLTDPTGSGAQVVVCVRDSLLATNEDLRDLANDDELVHIYRPLRWEEDSIQRYARSRLNDGANTFTSAVFASEALKSLAGLPFYCSLLVDLFAAGDLRSQYSDVDLLDHAVASIIEREYGKGTISPVAASEADLRTFVELLAVEDLERGFDGIGVETARELAEAVVPDSTPELDIDRFVTDLTQLPFFSAASPTTIRFAQEIIEQYLLGLALGERLVSQPQAFRRLIAQREIPADWITLRIVAAVSSSASAGVLTSLLAAAVGQPIEFKNLIQTLLFAPDGAGRLRKADVTLEYADLRNVIFESADLRGLSLRGADLTDALFLDCDLRDVGLEDAIIMNTRIEGSTAEKMQGLRVDGLRRFYSMRFGGRVVNSSKAAESILGQAGVVAHDVEEPCPAAQQLLILFGKYVRPSGEARRSWMLERGLLRGTRHASPEKVLAAAMRLGYLVRSRAPHRDQIERGEGDKYREIVEFVKERRLSPGLRALVSSVCTRDNCRHVAAID
jgi:pentapeptide repeat protein